MKTVINKPGYKHTPLGWIPEDWEVKELGEIFSFKNGINATKEAYGNGTKFINVMEVIYNEQITADIIPGSVKITEKQKTEYSVRNGDMLFNRTSETTDEIGLAAVYNDDEEVVYGGFVIRGREKYPAINNDFKRYCFRSQLVRNLIIKGGQGAVRSNIGQGDLQKVIVPLPPFSEQRRIATILSTWDAGIAQEQQLIDALQTRHRALMQQLLSGKKRLKGFKGEWKEMRLGDVSKISKGKALSANEIKDGKYPVIAGGKTSPYTHNAFTHENIITVSASGAYAGFVSFHDYKIWASDCSVIEQINGLSDIYYLKYQCMLKQDALYKLQAGGAQPHVFPKDINKLEILFHSNLKEQTAIANILNTSEKEIHTHRRRLAALQQQKKGLMQVLLTGKVRVKI